MKRLLLVFLVMLLIPVHGKYSPAQPVIATKKQEPPRTYILQTLTIYNPVANQCDKSPLITASNARIDIDKLLRQQIRWMALSRNMLKRWKGDFCYGDTVMLTAGDPSIDGLWVIHDNMNKRFKDRGDLLFHSNARKG